MSESADFSIHLPISTRKKERYLSRRSQEVGCRQHACYTAENGSVSGDDWPLFRLTSISSGKNGRSLRFPKSFLLLYIARWGYLYCILSSSTNHHTQAQNISSTTGMVDSGLDALVEKYSLKIDEQVNENLAGSRESNTPRFLLLYMWRWLNPFCPPVSYYQTRKQTKAHTFPTSFPQLPPEA